MAKFEIGAVNLREIDPSQGGEGLPPLAVGDGQLFRIVGSNVRESKNNPNNGFLELVLEVLEGPEPGAFGAYRFNIWHDSEKTVEIAMRQLSTLGHAIGVLDLPAISDDAPEDMVAVALHGKPFRADVALQKNQTADSKYTEIKKVYDKDGNIPSAHTAAAGTAASGAQWGGKKEAEKEPEQQPEQQQAPAASAASWKQNKASTPAANETKAADSSVPAWKRARG